MASRIKELDSEVVHKIAAGEIIVRPSNALKELIENSIDAKATRIDVLVNEGGIKMLQITDNGTGINVEDLPILCKRFTTSKLREAEDLETIATLGFRGEALASISHIAYLRVKTKTKDSRVATQAEFLNGELQESSVKKVAGVDGTQITVSDLFYNSRHRLEVFERRKSRTDEYHRILETVQKYAILYSDVAFTVKRTEDTQPVVVLGSTAKDRIKSVYEIGDLLSVETSDIEHGLKSAAGFVTGLSFAKKCAESFVLFINNRLVTSGKLAQAIRAVYTGLMPSKGVNYFVYLNLQIEPRNVDVNVHPTKREVKILYEQEIIAQLTAKIEEVLTKTEGTRDYRVQSYIASTTLPPDGSPAATRLSLFENSNVSSPRSALKSTPLPRYEYNLVRTDPKQQTLTPLVRSKESIRAFARSPTKPANVREEHEPDDDDLEEEEAPGTPLSVPEARHESPIKTMKSYREFKNIGLQSVHSLLCDVKTNASPELLRMISEHTFVGIVDAKRGLSAIQWDVRLYLIDHKELCRQMFYQIALTQFGNFGTIHLGDGLRLQQLLALDGSSSEISSMCEMAPMLSEYFQIGLESKNNDWWLVQLPLLLPEYPPSPAAIPRFLSQLVAVDWQHEQQCFEGVARALAVLYLPPNNVTRHAMMRVFDRAKIGFVPPRSLRSSVTEIANLPGLYRVFERC